MFYSSAVKKASLIACEAHKNDFDKSGYPYLLHPLFLAFQMNDENSVCVALLHDVIEDHGDKYSFDFLEQEGFNADVIEALKLLTHDKKVPYMDYIKAIGKNELARKVKIADLLHNSDVSRSGGKEPKKIELYRLALSYLTAISE